MRGGGHWTWRALIGAAAVTGKQGFTQSEKKKHINWWFFVEIHTIGAIGPGPLSAIICLEGGKLQEWSSRWVDIAPNRQNTEMKTTCLAQVDIGKEYK